MPTDEQTHDSKSNEPREPSQPVTATPLPVKKKLVDVNGLLEELFEPECRPSVRWVRTQTDLKAIPHIRIGHLIFFDVQMVKETLERKNLVAHRRTYETINHGKRGPRK